MLREFFAFAAQVLADIFYTLTEEFGLRRSRSLGLTGVSCLGSTLLATGKLLMGIVSLSFFTCVNAFYSYGMVAAKIVALTGVVRERNSRGQYRYCRLAALMLISASLCYLVYTLYLYWHPSHYRYHKLTALAIAAFAFTELGVSLWGVLRERRRGLPLFHTIKTLNLASALMALVLTQRAILSIYHSPEHTAAANALVGATMSLFATLLGAGLIRRIRRLEAGECYAFPFRRLRKLMSRSGLRLSLRPAYYIECGSQHYLGVYIDGTEENFEALCQLAQSSLDLYLLDARKHSSGQLICDMARDFCAASH